MRKNRKIRTIAKKNKFVLPKQFLWLGILLLFMSCYEVCVHFAEPRLLPIKRIRLEAQCERLDPATIKQHTLRYVKGFFSTDVMKLKEKLLNLPFVEEVSIKRIWPDTLLVTLVEQQFVATWGENAAVSSKGEVALLTLEDPSLPKFIGPDGQAALMLEQYKDIAKIIEPLNLTIKELDLNSRRSWEMKLNNNINVLMGRKDIGEKLATLRTVYSKLKKRHGDNIDVIDLRYPNGICVHTK